ncbi:fibronectin type III domain-containing protein [Patescibacteria group bacterium]|nr:fibronectin type III domain-containing protein [Patescibacteria group bacterium]
MKRIIVITVLAVLFAGFSGSVVAEVSYTNATLLADLANPNDRFAAIAVLPRSVSDAEFQAVYEYSAVEVLMETVFIAINNDLDKISRVLIIDEAGEDASQEILFTDGQDYLPIKKMVLRGSDIFLGTSEGVFQRIGDEWVHQLVYKQVTGLSYHVHSDTLYASTPQGLFALGSDEQDWGECLFGKSLVSVSAMDRDIYVATEHEIWCRRDGLAYWLKITRYDESIQDIYADSSQHYLAVATSGGSTSNYTWYTTYFRWQKFTALIYGEDLVVDVEVFSGEKIFFITETHAYVCDRMSLDYAQILPSISDFSMTSYGDGHVNIQFTPLENDSTLYVVAITQYHWSFFYSRLPIPPYVWWVVIENIAIVGDKAVATIEGLNPNTVYSVCVLALDPGSVPPSMSPVSNHVSFRTDADVTPPDLVALEGVSFRDGNMILRFTPSDEEDITYRVEINGILVYEGPSNGQLIIENVNINDVGRVSIIAIDEANMSSTIEEHIFVEDGQPGKIVLSWVPNPESDVMGYELERNGELVTLPNGSTIITSTGYQDNDVIGGVVYHYRLRAVDCTDNRGGWSGYSDDAKPI